MRTRFFPVDYFTSASATAAGGRGIQFLEFLRLPLPHLPAFNTPPSEHLLCNILHDVPVFDDCSSMIDKLPIDNALSKFFTDVLPHVIDDVNFEEPQIRISNQISFEEQDSTSSDKIDRTSFELAELEVPEVGLSLLPFQKNDSQFLKKNTNIFSELPEAEQNMDTDDHGLGLQGILQFQKSVYLVDDIKVEYLMEQRTDILEVEGSAQGLSHSSGAIFPLFEVDEVSLGILNSIDVGNILLIFESVEPEYSINLDEVTSDGKELLGPVGFDLLEYLSDPRPANECCEIAVPCSNFFLDEDFSSVTEKSHCSWSSRLSQGEVYVGSAGLETGILFEEFHYIDLEASFSYEVLWDAAKEIETETYECMFGEAMNFRDFSELIVCHELTLVEDSFKSLPIPLCSDYGKIISLHTFIEDILAQLEPQSSSISNDLYLEWHILEADSSDLNIYSLCPEMSGEIKGYDIDSELLSIDFEMLIFSFVLSDDYANASSSKQNEEILIMGSSANEASQTPFDGVLSGSLQNRGVRKRRNEDALSKSCVKNVTISTSQCNDLQFFLNPQNYRTGREKKSASWSVDTCVHPVTSSKLLSAGATTIAESRHWNVKVQEIHLSETILDLIDSFRKSFLAILDTGTELNPIHCPCKAVDNMALLCLPRDKIMDWMKRKSMPRTSFTPDDKNDLILVILLAIKHMAFYLCYYGVRAAYLYIVEFCRRIPCSRPRLCFLYNLIEDAHEKAEQEIYEIHPSLSVMHEILRVNLGISSSKILIVAEQVFWGPLKRLLTSMNISYNEAQDSFVLVSEEEDCSRSDFLLCSDCCLVTNEYVSASFPFDRFGVVLEYGGASRSSRISSISPKLNSLPVLYFLKVQVEDLSISNALCDGVELPKTIGLQKCENALEELLYFMPTEEIASKEHKKTVDEDEACSGKLAESLPVTREMKNMNSNETHFPDCIIIVNTQNFDKEMVISRRSTYQKILAMEKKGTQVIERDIDLPIDVIVSAAVCLAWYDCRNIRKKATTPDEASSGLPLCIESIAASVLTSLSFAFSGCILVFEGENSFLGDVMELSDELYAAAASLGIDLQLFFSYSSEMTDEIILSCIEVSKKLSRGLCPKMAESQSQVEFFLTNFPSINPLSAHVILCSSDMLVEFLGWSYEGQIHAVRNYQISHESIALLTATSRFGEREDSKSGMTECSSSVSSAPDSERVQIKSPSERKKQKQMRHPHEAPADIFHFEPAKLFTKDHLNPPRTSSSYDSWFSQSSETFDEFGNSSLSFDDLLGHRTQSDINMSRFFDAPMENNLQKSDQTEKLGMSQSGTHFASNQKPGIARMDHMTGQTTKASRYPKENLIGEVIDIEDTVGFRKEFPVASSVTFSPFVFGAEKDSAPGNSRTVRKPTLGANDHPNFDGAIEFDPTLEASNNIRARENSREGTVLHTDKINSNYVSFKPQEELLDMDMLDKAQLKSKLSKGEKDVRYYGGTPLSKALHSSQLQQGSPWTIEFLNRIREKSRLRQKSLLRNLSSSPSSYLESVSKVSKRKSPSILELYRFRGSSVPKKITEQKRQRRSSQPSSSLKNEKASMSYLPSCTPVDKRARRRLSFATSGSGGQSKLVWCDSDSKFPIL